MVSKYIRPEKDLLAFSNEDIDNIEKDYIKAYENLN